MALRVGYGLIAASAMVLLAPASHAQAMLQPYQMVRSLQVIQDRLADGDHAALPMQRKVLEMIDQRIRTSTSEDYQDRRNFRALVIYGMSGGNPVTIAAAVSRIELDDQDRKLGTAIVDYLHGDSAKALKSLNEIDSATLPDDVAAFVALIAGSVTVAEKPEAGYAFFDRARLLAPGTLVEEAALRRLIALSTQLKNAERFSQSSSQYVRRFLRSPYASQFADNFVSGVLQLRDTLDLDQVAQVIAGMTPEQSKVVYLRIARRAAIERHEGLVAFSRAGLGENADAAEPDPRAVLYESLAAIDSDRVEEVEQLLSGIDREKLSASDRRLLDAARGVVSSVVASPAQALERLDRIDAQSPVSPAPEDELPSPTPALLDASTGDSVQEAVPDAGQATTDFVSSTRQRLTEIDELLKETKE